MAKEFNLTVIDLMRDVSEEDTVPVPGWGNGRSRGLVTHVYDGHVRALSRGPCGHIFNTDYGLVPELHLGGRALTPVIARLVTPTCGKHGEYNARLEERGL